MELSQLPREMVAAVADHLNPRDLTHCSGVSVGWRRAFNLDVVWRSHCSFPLDHFRDLTNRVKPNFELPYVEGSELEPLCEWRVAFLKELHVMENWKNLHFASDEVELQTQSCLYMMDAVDELQNHWLFLCCTAKEGLKLEIWNIKGVPFQQICTKMSNVFKNIDETIQNNQVNFRLHLIKEKLLFIYDNLVTIYNFSYPNYELNFLYNFSFVHTAPFFTQRRISQLPEGSFSEVEVVGNLLYGVSYSPRDRVQQFSPSVHVWDISLAAKIKDHCIFEPRGRDPVPFISSLTVTSGNSQNLVITRTFEGAILMSSRIRVFDRIKCEYNKFYVQLKFPVIWTAVAGDYLVVCELINPLERDCIFHFYNTDSAVCLLRTNIYNIYDPEKISSSSSKFAFIDLHSNVTVFDIVTQEKVTTSLHPARNRLKTITMVNDELLLLESKYRGTSRSFQNVLVTSYEVWDFLRRTKPLRLDQCYRSMTRTKFTFVKNVSIPSKLLTMVHPLYRTVSICINSFW